MPAAVGGPLPAVLVVAGSLLMAVAIVGGAWLSLRRPGQQEAWLGAAAGALLVIALLHMLPDAWSAARAAGVWPAAVPCAALGSFAVSGLAAHWGCVCGLDRRHRAGAASAGALAVHRLLEGSALALASSVVVVLGLVVHAVAEGVAVGALFTSQPRRRVAGWLAAMCLSPIVGAAITGAGPLPAAAGPVLLAAAVGVLAQAARISLGIARSPAGGRMTPRTAGAVLAAAAVTALAVRALG